LSRVVRCLKTALLEGSCSIFRTLFSWSVIFLEQPKVLLAKESVIERYKKFVVKHIIITNVILSIFSSKNKERERERSFNTVDFHRFLLSQGALRAI
jgi:hypothetical protein